MTTAESLVISNREILRREPARSPLAPSYPIGQGYSLLETMTVIVVILTLATLATPMFRTLIVRGREAIRTVTSDK